MSQEMYNSNYMKINKRNNSAGKIKEGFKKTISFEMGFERWVGFEHSNL